MNNANAPAMPIASEEHANGIVSGHPTSEYTAGLTKREEIAARFAAAMLSNPAMSYDPNELAVDAIVRADALLAALEADQ
jgi:hypothetical protein